MPKGRLERGESSRQRSDDIQSDDDSFVHGGTQIQSRGLMLDIGDLIRFQHYKEKKIISWKYIDTPLLDTFGTREEVERLIHQPFWRDIFGWRDPTYNPIVREFVASMDVDNEVHNNSEPSIKFKLFNKPYHISVDTLGNLLGFYTLHDQDQEWYRNLLSDFENEHLPGLFWSCIAQFGTTWRASRVSARYIRRPEMSIVRKIIAHSWTGRKTNNSKVYRSDLFMLWSMDTETPINMGAICKGWMERQQDEDCEHIFIGPLVSRLCVALGHRDSLIREERVATMIPMTKGDFLDLNMVPVIPEYEEPIYPTFPPIPPCYANVHNWATMQAFVYQLHVEQEESSRRREKVIMDVQTQILDELEELEYQVERLNEDLGKMHVNLEEEGPSAINE